MTRWCLAALAVASFGALACEPATPTPQRDSGAELADAGGSDGEAGKDGATLDATAGTDATMADAAMADAAMADAEPGPRTLVVVPLDAQAYVDELVSFSAFMESAAGDREDVTGLCAWSIDDDQVGQLKAPGVFLVVGAGDAQVSAQLDDDSVSATLTGLAVDADVVRLSVEPAAIEVPVDLSIAVRALALYEDGQARDVTDLASFESLSPTVFHAEAPSGGYAQLQGVAEGLGTLRVRFADRQADVSVAVVAATLVDLEFYPAELHVPVGDSVQMYSIGRFADGALHNLTDAVTWSSADDDIATISSAAGSRGILTGVAEGSVEISVTDDATGITATATAVVSPAQIVALNVDPAVIRMAAGSSVGLRATAVLTSEVSIDVSRQAQWTLADPDVALLVDGAYGLRLEGVYPAATTLTCSYGGRSTAVAVTVTAAVLEAVEIYPEGHSMPVGSQVQLYLLGTYSDGSRGDLTGQATWTSDHPAVALVAQSPPGRVTAQAPGEAGINASVDGFEAAALVTVTDAVVVSIQINPPTASVPVGDDLQFDAFAIYSDNSQRGFTWEVTWSVDDEAIATVSNAWGLRGLAVGHAAGSVTVTASYEELQDTAVLEVTDATVANLLVTPDPVVLTPGRSKQVNAYASYTSGSTLYVAEQATWTSSDTNVVQVANAAYSRGLATGIHAGQATVTASFGGASSSTTVYVLAQPIDAVVIFPQQVELAPLMSVQLVLVGLYDDVPNLYEYLTAEAVWESSNPSVASVGNFPSEPGRLRAHAAGSTTVTARFGELETSQSFGVRDATLTGLSLSPTTPTLAVDVYQSFVALGAFDDDRTADLTHDVVFSSDDNTVITMVQGNPGLSIALSAGSTSIRARLGEVEADTLVTVSEAQPVTVILSPVHPIVELWDEVRFYATAVYDDGSRGDVTLLCRWSSSDPQVLLSLDDPWSKGYGYGMAIGTSTVTARCGELQDSTQVTVR